MLTFTPGIRNPAFFHSWVTPTPSHWRAQAPSPSLSSHHSSRTCRSQLKQHLFTGVIFGASNPRKPPLPLNMSMAVFQALPSPCTPRFAITHLLTFLIDNIDCSTTRHCCRNRAHPWGFTRGRRCPLTTLTLRSPGERASLRHKQDYFSAAYNSPSEFHTLCASPRFFLRLIPALTPASRTLTLSYSPSHTGPPPTPATY